MQTLNIYKATNTVTGKVYVGQTRYSPQRRFQWHKYNATKGRGKSPLDVDIVKYGADKFEVELIEGNVLPEDADERERYWITTLHTLFPNGYNVYGGGRDTFDKMLRYGDYGEYGIRGRYGYSSHGRIVMCDKETEAPIRTFGGVMDAERYLRKHGHTKANHWPITKCCLEKQKSAYGYKWKFKDKE